MEFSFNDFIEQFNNNELDVKSYFNDYDTFFSLAKKKGLLSEIDPIHTAGSDEWQNDYLIFLYENDKEKFREYVEKLLGDIEFDETGNVYIVRNSLGDLAGLFCDYSRDSLGRDSVEQILNSEDIFEPYYDTTHDVYDDVIDELTPENLEYLKKYIVEELSGQQLSPETTEMELIASEQGHEDYWEINMENVTRILDDKESMDSLLDDELVDLRSSLVNIHTNSYNAAYESEIYDTIMSELDDYFVMSDKKFQTIPHPYKKETQIEQVKIPIRNFYDKVTEFLEEYKGYREGTLEYWGSYLGLLADKEPCLNPRYPDYPDYREVDKNINEFFGEYL